jgi:thiamine pyrophosphokinase
VSILVCYYKNDSVLYKNPDFDYCFIDNTTNIKIIEKNNFTIYPNPAKNNVQFTMNNEQLIGSRIEIVNINGQTVKQFTVNNLQCTINVEDLGKGIYFVKLISEHGVSTQKLVVE